MNVRQRQNIERKILRRVVDDALRAGYLVSVYDGEETVLFKSANRAAVLAACFSTDEDWLFIHRPRQSAGTVRFIYGNNGYDVINDYSVSLEELLAGANKVADKMEELYG